MEDPETWTESWTAVIRMNKSDDALYEYACHEGNIGMEGICPGRACWSGRKRRAGASRPRRSPTATGYGISGHRRRRRPARVTLAPRAIHGRGPAARRGHGRGASGPDRPASGHARTRRDSFRRAGNSQ